VSSRQHAIALLFVVLTCSAARTVHANDKSKAAEHFALAESAEKRKDWHGAISEYELAYAASPHPWALFNIAVNYERLEEGRNAATYFQRYLKESPDAQDRDEVLSRIEKLRAKRSRVDVTTEPNGATVFVDDEDRGTAPLTLELTAGEHEIHIAHDGRRSPDRRVVTEFGDPIKLRIDLDARPGTFLVRSNVSGAEVRLNGELVGETPFTGSIPAGEYQLLVSMPGYRSVQRTVTVPPDGSEQVRADLVSIEGKPAAPPESSKWLLGLSYGLHATGEGMRYLFQVGFRPPSNRWELGGQLGTLGYSGAVIGAEARLYLATGRVRPYVRVGILSGAAGTGSTEERVTVVEGGAGILVAGRSVTRPSTGRSQRRVGFGIDYFLEADVGGRLQKPPEGESRYVVPIIGGIMLRYGG